MQKQEPLKVAKIAAYGVIINALLLSVDWIFVLVNGVSAGLTMTFVFTIITLVYFAWLVLVSIKRA